MRVSRTIEIMLKAAVSRICGTKAIPHRGLLLLAGVLVHSGCVALNIPSRRDHDPRDRGGLLGGWESQHEINSPDDVVGQAGVIVGQASETLRNFDGGPLVRTHSCDGEICADADLDRSAHIAKKQEQVPWPRFHPIPTRPIYGGVAEMGDGNMSSW
ncbi:MAG: hypothetical protein AAF958_08325 [Planctomycetota bacterium]